MEETWTQRADKIIEMMRDLPVSKPDSPEMKFKQAVWSLCQEVKQLDEGFGQFVPDPLY